MTIEIDRLYAFAAALEEVLPDALCEARADHPLLRKVVSTGVAQISIPVDVKVGEAIATYDVPTLLSGASLQLGATIASMDRVVELGGDIIGLVVRDYERSVRTGLYTPASGFLGIGGLLPEQVGTNVIGGISEVTVPGWRSHVTQTRPTMYESFAASERLCFAGGKAPDLSIFGTNAYRELVMSIQPQQRFTTVRAGIPMLKLHSGAIFHDPFCHTDSGYMVHTTDFQFHASPFEVVADIGIDGRIRVSLRRREQLIASRRYRSGTITPRLKFT